MPNDFIAWCHELLAPLGPVRSRRMFGGHGLYVDDLFIALVFDDELYLKADAQTQPSFEAAGCPVFSYTTAQGQTGQLRYHRVPAEAMESPAQMAPWARLALASALRARASKPAAPRRAKAATPTSNGRSKRAAKP
jgi:DNA transformation protein